MFKRISLFLAYKFKLLSIRLIPWYVARKFLNKKGDFLFIDCGSNVGQGYNHFKKYFSTDRFDYVLIEPNPNCAKILIEKYGNDAEIIEKGVWTSETELDLFGLDESNDELSEGGSLIKSHNSSFYKTKKNEVMSLVSTINFSEFLKQKKEKYDVIIVKMDIESSEYIVLPFIIEDGSVNLIDHIFVEFHSEFFDLHEKNKYLTFEKKIIRDFKRKNIGFTRWI